LTNATSSVKENDTLSTLSSFFKNVKQFARMLQTRI